MGGMWGAPSPGWVEKMDAEINQRLGNLVVARTGVGPHIVTHIASGQKALCGGPGYCQACDEKES